jgi:hypothetical protein
MVDTRKKPQPGTREYAAEDLQRLVKCTQDTEDLKVEEDLPPLLQVKMYYLLIFLGCRAIKPNLRFLSCLSL